MAQWYIQNDYFFTHLEKIEINIKVVSEDNIIVSVFDHNRSVENTLVAEFNLSSIEDIKEKLLPYTKGKINLPNLSNFLQLQN